MASQNLLPETVSEPEVLKQMDDNEVPESPTISQQFDSIFNANSALPLSNLSFRDRLIQLEDRDFQSSDTDVLSYWSKIRGDPEMSAIAAVVLAIPVTQVFVERSFN